MFADDPRAQKPFELVNGGSLEVYIRICARAANQTEVAFYKMTVQNLPANENDLVSLRYDKPQGQRRGQGWDEDLADNPEHPWAHLHVNFDKTVDANNCRLPTGEVSPILFLAFLDHWYCTTFGV